ncbi:uncharacterized protein LOC107482151 [Arachis duranensis]|uniref:Uncharacterized protein LOC107482151 n=1 Tax=Arachis duranensis TaxID=130453 RepID=A0A6P5N5X2_ARADU|nr:uncharacterized protein LOC107482151 [Arachis duranensis]
MTTGSRGRSIGPTICHGPKSEPGPSFYYALCRCSDDIDNARDGLFLQCFRVGFPSTIARLHQTPILVHRIYPRSLSPCMTARGRPTHRSRLKPESIGFKSGRNIYDHRVIKVYGWVGDLHKDEDQTVQLKGRGESDLRSVRSSQASASAKSWDRLANPQEQMGERQVARQEGQDQDKGADVYGVNGEKHSNIFGSKDDGTANHKKEKKEEATPQNQQASESVSMGNVKEAKGKDKAEYNVEESNRIPRKHKERSGPSIRRTFITERGAWPFTNQGPNRNRQQARSGPIEEERNLTIRELLKEFNKNMVEEKRKKIIEEGEEEAHQRNKMDIDGLMKQYKINERESEQKGKQIVTESEGGFYYVELAEEEEEIEQKNSKAIVVAREYETELVQRMERKLQLKRGREENPLEQTAGLGMEEEEATQMWRANKKNKWSRKETEEGAHEEGPQIRLDLEDSMAEEAGLHMPPTQP